MDFNRLSRNEIAAAFGVDPRTITRWYSSGMPRNGDGSYVLPDCISWCVERAKNIDDPKCKEPDEATKWLTEFRKERAKIARLERLQYQGSLLKKNEVVRKFTERAYELARGLLMLSRRVSYKLAASCEKQAGECQLILDQEVHKLMDQYTRPLSIQNDKSRK